MVLKLLKSQQNFQQILLQPFPFTYLRKQNAEESMPCLYFLNSVEGFHEVPFASVT